MGSDRNARRGPSMAGRVIVAGVAGVAGVVALGPWFDANAGAAAPVTYTESIAPILAEHCVPCHRPGGIGPFSLLDADAARQRAPRLAAATARRAMPPWKPVAPVGVFRNERRLSAAQIALIERWAAAGAPLGPPVGGPAPVSIDGGWPLGRPDLVVRFPAPYRLEPGPDDVYRKFVLPVPLRRARWIRALDVRPGSGAVHHARIELDRTGRSRGLDAADPGPGYGGFMADAARFPPGHVLGWAPGKMPTALPDELAWALDPATDLVVQLHMIPDATSIAVQPEVGLYFARGPARRQPVAILLNSLTIDIPAGAAAHVVRDRYRLPIAVDLLALYPHAHYLAREMLITATPPDGTERTLLRIDDWDFNWQDEYRYRAPVPLPAGTIVEMRYTYDNTAANPHNPHDPPRPVRFGPQSTDEMAQLMLQVLPRDARRRTVLADSLRVKAARDEILGYQARLRRDPGDHESRAGLAVRFLELGEIDGAIAELRQAIQLAPAYADAHYNLGSALLARGAVPEAIAAYRDAVAADPDYAEAHTNLGALLERTGRRADAIAHYRRAIAADASLADAHYNLGSALAADGRLDAAAAAYRNALAVRPGLVGALLDLAWLRATAPWPPLRDPQDAERLVRRAAAVVGPDHPVVLDTLAAAQAADGRFDAAIATATRAAARARATPGFETRAAAIARRVALYRRDTPYRLPH